MNRIIHLLLIFISFSINLQSFANGSDTLKVDLEDLFRIADSNSRMLKVSAYDEQLAVEEIQQHRNKLLPSLDASLSISYNGDGWLSNRDFSHGMNAPIPDFGNNFALEATQLIYAGGTVRTSIEIGKLHLLISRLDKEKHKQDIRFMISGYFLELQKLQNQRQILQSNMQQTEKLLQQLRNKLAQGVLLKNAVTRYELQKQSLELGLVNLEAAERIINNELVKTLQLPKEHRLSVKGFRPSPIEDKQPASQWHSLAQENAPVLHQMQLQLEQARYLEKLAQADKKPEVFGFAVNRLDGPIMIEVPTINKNFNYWYAGVGMKYNIASWYKSSSKIRASRIATQKAEETRAMVQDQLATDIEAAIIRGAEARKVYETKLKGMQLANENYTVVRNRYLDDLVLITEMLDAQNSKIDAEMQVANAQINILYHYYHLKKLTGTL